MFKRYYRQLTIASIGISGLAFAFIYNRRKDGQRSTLDIDRSIRMLNAERIDRLSLLQLIDAHSKSADELLSRCSTRALAQLLTIRPSIILSTIAPQVIQMKHHTVLLSSTESIRSGLERILLSLMLISTDDLMLRSIDRKLLFYTANIADENNPTPYDDLVEMADRPDYTKRIAQLLNLLLLHSSIPDQCTAMVEQGVLLLLLRVINEFADKNLTITSLKVVSNIALVSSSTCDAILNYSDWLRLLAKMMDNSGRNDIAHVMASKIVANMLHTYGVRDVCFGADVYPIYEPEDGAEPVVDILLLHGLRGGVFRTWRQKDGCVPIDQQCQIWPKAWLPHDLNAPVRIIAIDYTTSLSEWKRNDSQTLTKRSDRLMHQLENAGVGSRPLIAICHSMGGLLLKRLVLDSPTLIGTQLNAVAFLATPHGGSPLASASMRTRLRPLLLPSADVRLLVDDDAQRRQLNDDFDAESSRHIRRRYLSVAELEPTQLLKGYRNVLVPNDSAYLGRGAYYQLADSHLNVCKPADNRNSAVYGLIVQWANDAIDDIR